MFAPSLFSSSVSTGRLTERSDSTVWLLSSLVGVNLSDDETRLALTDAALKTSLPPSSGIDTRPAEWWLPLVVSSETAVCERSYHLVF